tara:strand:- start:765 stop:1889 length:1125 start_codon:yes stop_codon:yes gene_type:complete
MSEKIFSGVFRDKSVLVTGHTGFMGSWLSLWLKYLGANVIGLSLEPPTRPSFFEILELRSKIESIIGDIRDKKITTEVFEKYKPEFVFHLAAQSLVRISYNNPVETLETNIIGTANILDSIRKTKETKVGIVMTSDKCYENELNNRPHIETDPMGGFDPYSASKGAAELIISSYRNSFFSAGNNDGNAKIASIRAGNIIGGGDWAKDRIIPDTIKAITKKEDVLLRNPKSIRPWQHVLEPISGMLWLSTRMYQGEDSLDEAWNLGPDNSNKFFSVKEIVEMILNRWKCKTDIEIIDNSNEPFESKILQIDPSKANNILEWKNVFSVEEAITETVSWYKAFIEDPKVIEKETKREIDNYILRANENDLIWSKKEN